MCMCVCFRGWGSAVSRDVSSLLLPPRWELWHLTDSSMDRWAMFVIAELRLCSHSPGRTLAILPCSHENEAQVLPSDF